MKNLRKLGEIRRAQEKSFNNPNVKEAADFFAEQLGTLPADQVRAMQQASFELNILSAVYRLNLADAVVTRQSIQEEIARDKIGIPQKTIFNVVTQFLPVVIRKELLTKDLVLTEEGLRRAKMMTETLYPELENETDN